LSIIFTFAASSFSRPCVDAMQRDAQQFVTVVNSSDDAPINTELAVVMKRMWNDRGVQECFRRSREYQLNDSAE